MSTKPEDARLEAKSKFKAKALADKAKAITDMCAKAKNFGLKAKVKAKSLANSSNLFN